MEVIKTLGYLAILGILLWYFFGDDVRQFQARRQPTIEVTSEVLWADYNRNEVAADNQYKGRQLRLAGKVTALGRDLRGISFIILDGGVLFGVQCFFDDDAAVASLSKGQTITVEGMGAGKIGNIMLNGCELR